MITNKHNTLTKLIPRSFVIALVTGIAGCVFLSHSASLLAAENISPCYLIEDTVERLMCYDARYGRDTRDKNTSPEPDTKNTENQPSDSNSIVLQRLKKEEILTYNRFAIAPHKPNYILPLTYNHNPNSSLYDTLVPDDELAGDLDKYELKFQLSFKIPLFREFFHEDSSLWFAYSQLAFWQMYNVDISSPFRETNYEPELIWVKKTSFDVLDFNSTFFTLALNHQSNGRSKPLSRSWNRIIAQFILEKNNTVLSYRPWYRIPDSEDDDGNPDIEKYLGYAEFSALHKYKEHLSTIMFRNNLRSSDNKTTVEITYTFQFSNRFKGIAQYFNGYGESLIDYNHRAQRLGVGIMITDWL